QLGQLLDVKLFGELVEHAEFARLGRILHGQGDATNGVADVEKAARLPALSVDGKRMSDGGLHAKTVERGAPHFIVIETVDQPFVEGNLIRHGAVDHALIQVRGPQPPY